MKTEARNVATDAPHVQAAAYRAGFDARVFRRAVRVFCAERLPPDIARTATLHRYFSREQRVRWQQILERETGWLTAHWPHAFGGRGWGYLQRLILLEELERAGTPWITPFGFTYLGPVLCEFGTAEQQARFLPGIADSTTWWAQGFSEPGAGSDLGAVAMRAERTSTGYRCNGQKIWTTMAHWADMIFCLVRTASTPRRSDGLSLLLIDLRAPGVTVRGIETFDECRHVNEVFFEDVLVPESNRVGAEGQGWAITRFIVDRERLLAIEIGKARRLLDTLLRLGAEGDGSTARDRSLRRRLAPLEVRYETLRASAYEAAIAADEGRGSPVDPSLLKIRGSELQQSIHDVMVDVLGRDGLTYAPAELAADGMACPHAGPETTGLVFEHLYARATSIYGGSNEIQREIIARHLPWG